MARKSTIIKNWPKYILQWGVLAALILFLTGIIPSKEAVDPETYCPMGGLQALTTYLAQGSLPCSMSSVQVMMGIALVSTAAPVMKNTNAILAFDKKSIPASNVSACIR